MQDESERTEGCVQRAEEGEEDKFSDAFLCLVFCKMV